LAEEVSHKEDRDTRLVLSAGKAKVFLEVVKTCESDCIAVKIIEPREV